MADLQKKADDAQKAANDADGKYGNIKQQIIDLLKDFIGITDIEECITKGSISSCLWAAFDVGSWIFAALKIGKFAKAVKDAIVLWKDFNRGRKIIDRAKDAARRARELLKNKRLACGLPAAYPNAPPGGVVHASFAALPVRAREGGCFKVTSKISEDSGLVKAAEEAGKNQKVQKDLDHMVSELQKGNPTPGMQPKSLGKGVTYVRGRNGGRLFLKKTADGYEIVGKSDKSNETKVINILKKKYDIK